MPDAIAPRPIFGSDADLDRFIDEQRQRFAEMDRQAMRDLRRAHVERMRSLLTTGLI